MFDVKTIRDDPAAFDEARKRRCLAPVAGEIVALDERVRGAKSKLQAMLERRNQLSREIGAAKGQGDDAADRIAEVGRLKDEARAAEEEERAASEDLDALLAGEPNLPEAGVPTGADESANVEQRRWGEPRAFDFEVRDHVDIGLGIVGAEDLDPHLGELPVAPGLGLLVAELRALVPDLPRRHRSVLRVGPTDAGGQLGPQRESLRWVALVVEVEHLLGHDVGGLTQPSEHPEILEDRRDDFTEATQRRLVGEPIHERATPARFGREDVAGAFGGTEGRFGHSRSGYRCEHFTPWKIQPSGAEPPGMTR